MSLHYTPRSTIIVHIVPWQLQILKEKKEQRERRRETVTSGTNGWKIWRASLPANKSASFRVGCDSSGGSIDRKRFRGSRVGRPRVSLHYQSIFRSSTRSRPTYYILFSQLVVQCCTSAFASWPTVKQRKSRSLPIDRRSLLCSNWSVCIRNNVGCVCLSRLCITQLHRVYLFIGETSGSFFFFQQISWY